MDKIAEAKKVFDTEIIALEKTRDILDQTFIDILDKITSCQGKVILTGMGKPGHIARKIAATMSSLGTPAFFLHPAEAQHGDLGMITDKDIVIAISYSGESEEVTKLIPNIKLIGAPLIGITANSESTLAVNSDIVQVLPQFEEACYLGLAPTSSTTVVLAYGDALAVVASGVYGFKDKDFGMYHPAGSLGKKLILQVENLMAVEEAVPVISSGSLLTDAIVEMSKKGLGVVSIVDENCVLQGLLTDGDIRRIIERHIDVYSAVVDDVMTKSPVAIKGNIMAVDALKLLKKRSLNCLPVVNEENEVVGTVTLQMIVKAGIVI